MEKVGGGIAAGDLFLILLTIVFVTLKLLGKITWSWVWVLAPIWLSFVIGFIVAFIALAIFLAILLFKRI